MTPEQITEFLYEPHIANIATIGPDGSPHVTPVWHHYENKKIYILVGQSTIKLRNIRRDPRVSVSISTDEAPYKYVLINDSTIISEKRIPELVLKMAVNYLGPERGEQYTKDMLSQTNFVLLTITPSKIVSWNGDQQIAVP